MHVNLHISTISRGSGRNSVAASAYRSGRSVVAAAAYRSSEALEDERSGKKFDYTRKENVLHNEIVTPDNAPAWMSDRTKLWNGVEAAEKRKDAQLAKEVVLTLPRDLDHEQHKEVVTGWINKNITSRGLVADYAIHEPDASDGGKNPHAHVMFTCRPVEGDGFGKKLTGYQNGKIDSKAFLQNIREGYEDQLNSVAAAGNDNAGKVYDMRSYRLKGEDRIPQPKKGPKVTWLEKQGYTTSRSQEVTRVNALNEAKAARQKFISSFDRVANENHKAKREKEAAEKTGQTVKKMARSKAYHGYREYKKTTSKFGSGGRHGSPAEMARQDVANSYYDVMYGDGSQGSYERENQFER